MSDYLQTSINSSVIKNDSVDLLISNAKNTRLLVLTDELQMDSKGAWLVADK